MLESYEKGFACVTEYPDGEIGISFESRFLEDCKRWCCTGQKIVLATPKRCGFNIQAFTSAKPYERRLRFSRADGSMDIFRLHFRWSPMWRHVYGKEAIYEG